MKNGKFLRDFVLISSFHVHSQLYSYLGCKHMFSAKFKEICCKFAENNIFEISEKSAKML